MPVESHYEYWRSYPIKVIGIVYVPQLGKAFWVDIKKYFEENGKVSTIKIIPNRVNEFSQKTFNQIILQIYSKSYPNISYSEVTSFVKSKNAEEFEIGLISGFVFHSGKNEFWDLIVNYLFKNDVNKISAELLYFLSFATKGVDAWHSSTYNYKDENLIFANELLSKISKENIIKLLVYLVNSEQTISRGSIGSSIESIISNAKDLNRKLIEIIYDRTLDKEI